MHARQKVTGGRSGRTDRTPRPSADGEETAARVPVTPAAVGALQRSAGNMAISRARRTGKHADDAASQRALIQAAMSSPGRQPVGPMRAELESFYQSDFSAARIHDNPTAQRAAAAMGAVAMTIGTHVFLGAGAAARKDIIGHEFGHVSQNLKGVTETGDDHGAGVAVTNPGQESERIAAANGAAFAAGVPTAPSVTARRAAGDSTGVTPAAVQRAYGRGAYGNRDSERRRLERLYGARIDGNRTHQAEHVYGHEAMTSRSGLRRRQPGPAGAPIRETEAMLPAYYETYRAHREHPGTGTGRRRRPALDMSAAEYRAAQYDAVSRNDPFTALALNQAGYAQLPSWRGQAGTVAGRQADDSYENMLRGGASALYFPRRGHREQTRPLNRNEQADLAGYRRFARAGRYPSLREQEDLLHEFGGHTRQLRSMGRPADRELAWFPDDAGAARRGRGARTSRHRG